jgi:hypothetical protein
MISIHSIDSTLSKINAVIMKFGKPRFLKQLKTIKVSVIMFIFGYRMNLIYVTIYTTIP